MNKGEISTAAVTAEMEFPYPVVIKDSSSLTTYNELTVMVTLNVSPYATVESIAAKLEAKALADPTVTAAVEKLENLSDGTPRNPVAKSGAFLVDKHHAQIAGEFRGLFGEFPHGYEAARDQRLAALQPAIDAKQAEHATRSRRKAEELEVV